MHEHRQQQAHLKCGAKKTNKQKNNNTQIIGNFIHLRAQKIIQGGSKAVFN